ncbi:MAG: hypothetical protein UE866_05195 [Clostridia bacterium]|nr:hypothetical protein [Clostridia bacterium]
MYIVDYNLLGFNTLKSLDKSIKIPLYEGGHDMYPLYWTPSKEGILMRYSYEYKKECVELYRQVKWA